MSFARPIASLTMAPIATQTVTQPSDVFANTFGNYKEQAAGAKSFNKKLEEEGDGTHPAVYSIFHPSYSLH